MRAGKGCLKHQPLKAEPDQRRYGVAPAGGSPGRYLGPGGSESGGGGDSARPQGGAITPALASAEPLPSGPGPIAAPQLRASLSGMVGRRARRGELGAR